MNEAPKKPYDVSLFIFRRDLRLEDNTGLLHCLRLSTIAIPCFILDKKQLDRETNEYFGDNHLQFLVESLKDLNQALGAFGSRLFYFHGAFDQIFRKMVIEMRPQAVFINGDVTPYDKNMDKTIEEVCKQHCAKFFSFDDITILKHDSVISKAKTCFKVFNSYFQAASKVSVPAIEQNHYKNYQNKDVTYQCEFSADQLDSFYKKNVKIAVHGGREEGKKKLANMDEFKNYNWIQNNPTYQTTCLSAYMKCGCLSPREVYHKVVAVLSKRSKLVKQLFWRDFFSNLIKAYPEYLERSMKPQYQYVSYENNPEFFQKWKEGKTGYPFVDAAMRKLNATGHIISSLRLLVGHFLVMDLHVDWKLGEKYFASKLVDFDVATSNGGWQLCAGSGVQRRRWLKVPNPWRQSSKHDKNAEFIKKWIPELKDCEPKDLHNWERAHKRYPNVKYPKPIVKHKEEAKKTLKMYSASAQLHRKNKNEATKGKKGTRVSKKQAASDSEDESEDESGSGEEDEGLGSESGEGEDSGSSGSEDESTKGKKEKSKTKASTSKKTQIDSARKVRRENSDMFMDIEEEFKGESKREKSKSSKSKTPAKGKKKDKEESKNERSSSAKKGKERSKSKDKEKYRKEKSKKPRKSSQSKDKLVQKNLDVEGKQSKRKKPVSSNEGSEDESEVFRKSTSKSESKPPSVAKKLDKDADEGLRKVARTIHTPDVRKNHGDEDSKNSTKTPVRRSERQPEDEIIDLPKVQKPKISEMITIDNIGLFKFGWNKPKIES